MAGQRLGQNFLADPAWRARVLTALGAQSGDTWLEIGAGRGELTEALAQQAARVVAIELDPRLVDGLCRVAEQQQNLTVVAGDVLKLDLEKCAGAGRFRVYGSLPYYITSPILHRLFEHAAQIDSIHVVVQFEVAERLAARPGCREYGYLSVATQYFTQPEIRFRIPPGAFRPRPKVASALVGMRLPGAQAELRIADEAGFLRFVQACFAQKRKMLSNNLRALLSAEEAEAAMRAANIAPKARAEELTVAQFAALWNVVPRRDDS